MREFLPVSGAALVKPLCVPQFVGTDRMRPRITKAKLCGGFLGNEFVGCLNDRAKGITQLAGIFPVDVVNAPELLAGLQSRNRFHGNSSSQTAFVKMYQLHKMRGQSTASPMSGPAKTKFVRHRNGDSFTFQRQKVSLNSKSR